MIYTPNDLVLEGKFHLLRKFTAKVINVGIEGQRGLSCSKGACECSDLVASEQLGM